MLRLLQKAYHCLCPRLEVTKSLLGLRCRVNINDHLMWLMFPQSRTIEAGSHALMARYWGNVWDIGSNFGFYSMVAARAGNKVVAFDMSHHVLEMLQRSCRLNRVAVTTVAQAITPTPLLYAAPCTSACTNRCTPGSGESRSITYLEAVEQYGLPAFIKMDIEGGEREFLENPAFCKWIEDNRITLLLETHHGYRPAPASFSAMNMH